MPIDSSIYSGLAKGLDNPFAKLGDLQQARAAQMEVLERQRKMQKARALEGIWTELGGTDIQEALRRTYEVDPETASEIEQRYASGRAAWALEKQREDETEQKQFKHDLSRLYGSQDDPVLFPKLLTEIQTRNPDFAPTAEALRDPTRRKPLLAQLFESQGNIDQIFDRRRAATEAFGKGDTIRGAAGMLAAAHGTPEFEEALQGFAPVLGPAYTKLFRTATTEQLEQWSMTPNERADNEQARLAAQAQATQTAVTNTRADAAQRIAQGHLTLAEQNYQLAVKRLAQGDRRLELADGSSVEISEKVPPLLVIAAREAMPKAATRQPAYFETINVMAAQPDGEEHIKRLIRNTAVENELADDKRVILGRGEAAAQLREIQADLRTLRQAGVSTNLITGNVEEVARKLGTTSNPEYVRIGTKIANAHFRYRRALTGATFGEKEAEQYAKLAPRFDQTFEVNEAVIDGLLESFSTFDREYWERKLGPSGAVLVGALPPPSTAPPGARPPGQAPPGQPGPRNQTPIGGEYRYEVTAPNGKNYGFKTQAEADAFKAKAGIR